MSYNVIMSAWFSVAFFSAASAAVGFLLFSGTRQDSGSLGIRGLKRKEALRDKGWFAFVEPFMVQLSIPLRFIGLPALRRQVDVSIRQAGYYLGLRTDEFFALSLMSAGLATAIGLLVCRVLSYPDVLALFFCGLGLALPYTRLRNEVAQRVTQINRALPAAVDLLALCIGAGLDFPGSLQQIISRRSAGTEALDEEFSWLLKELNLGMTRKEGLLEMADRVPSRAMQQLVHAVVQSETRGTPLVEVLRVQASNARRLRSLQAEEMASRAGVLMLGPLALMMFSIMLLLLGPFMLGYGF